MTQGTTRTRGYGRYLSAIMVCCDLLLINLIFIPLVLLTNGAVGGHHGLRLITLLFNVSYLPVAVIFTKMRVQRSIHIDRVVSMGVQAAMLLVCIFFVVAVLCRYTIGYTFLIRLLGANVVLLPLSWVVTQECIKALRRRGRNYVRVIIVGTNPTAVTLLKSIESNSQYGYRFMGFFDNALYPGFDGRLEGNLNDIEAYVKTQNIDEIYFCISGNDDEAINRVRRIADDNFARFAYVPQLNRYVTGNYYLSNVGQIPVLETHHTRLENPLNRLVKRTFDILFSGLFLIFSPLIFIPVAIAIKLSSPGPVFFKQKRTGYRGRDFLCYKFRTMRVNADADSRQATLDDPRKTRVGEFLRKTSIDELPQFINVLKGDMSVVGPRPHMLKHTEVYRKLISEYMVRHQIKPGVTGWAQVRGFRGPTDELWKMEQRVSHDVWYIEHWSFTLDLKIIVRTVVNAIHGEENAN